MLHVWTTEDFQCEGVRLGMLEVEDFGLESTDGPAVSVIAAGFPRLSDHILCPRSPCSLQIVFPISFEPAKLKHGRLAMI